MFYCAAFDCNANSSKNRITCSSFTFPTQPTLVKKWRAKTKPSKFKSTNHKLLSTAHGEDGGPGLSSC